MEDLVNYAKGKLKNCIEEGKYWIGFMDGVTAEQENAKTSVKHISVSIENEIAERLANEREEAELEKIYDIVCKSDNYPTLTQILADAIYIIEHREKAQ